MILQVSRLFLPRIPASLVLQDVSSLSAPFRLLMLYELALLVVPKAFVAPAVDRHASRFLSDRAFPAAKRMYSS